jgi:hypothetical protein
MISQLCLILFSIPTSLPFPQKVNLFEQFPVLIFELLPAFSPFPPLLLQVINTDTFPVELNL